MYIGTSEPCIGIAHLVAAFPRASALLATVCLVTGTTFYILPRDVPARACTQINGTVYDGGDAQGALCAVPPK